MKTPDDQRHASIDAALANWRQGDCVLEGEHWFVYRTDNISELPQDEHSDLLESEVPGLVVITQSCDIVRKYKDRPYVSVAPLAQVSDVDLVVIGKGYRPQFAAIPAITAKNLVADLDRVMTVDKQVVARWTRMQGCANDIERRTLARALERKHGRFAFPNDFNGFVAELHDRIGEKHDKRSEEGDALRGLDEIRVQAKPTWESTEVELMFWFIAKPKDVSEVRRSGFLAAWEKRIAPKGRFKRVFTQIATHQELTAEDYVISDRLDLDHLSEA